MTQKLEEYTKKIQQEKDQAKKTLEQNLALQTECKKHQTRISELQKELELAKIRKNDS